MSYDEIEGDPLTLVMFHERLYFPLLLDHAMQEGFSELLLFLIETDKLRMDEDLEAPLPSADVINRIYMTYLSNENGTVRKCAEAAGINCNKIKHAVEMCIPLQTIFASVCECVWRDVFRRMKALPYCDMWPSVRKAILEDDQGHGHGQGQGQEKGQGQTLHMELLTVISNDSNRLFYERHIRSTPSDLACMHVWLSVRDMLRKAKEARLNLNTEEQHHQHQNQKQGHHSSGTVIV
jgi:hypothetical protein